MYLDFAIDLIKAGDKVIVTCGNEIIEGVVERINKSLIAIRQLDGSIIIKGDDVITNIQTVSDKPNTIAEPSQSNISPSHKDKSRCGMILIKKDKPVTFYCSRCRKMKTSKKYAIKENDPDYMICNGCYGFLLSRLENN